MPSMASVILRAADRAASSAAWAAPRCAAAARSGSGGSAASDPLMRASSVAAAASDPLMRASSVAAAAARSPASSGGSVRSRLAQEPLDPLFVKPDWKVFEADEKDLESDEALWALYERWCKFFKQDRDRDEMARRFGYFKETVFLVEENKKSDLPYRLGSNQFADGKLAELYSNSCTSIPYSAAMIYMRYTDGFFEEEDPKGPGQAAGATEATNPSA